MKMFSRTNPLLSRWLKLFPLIVLVFVSCFSSVFAASLKIETIDVAPFGMMGNDGKPTGMMYEISNLIATEAGIPYENSLTAYARTVFDLESGTTSVVLRFTNEDLEKNSIQVVPVIAMPTIIIGVKGVSYKSLADLHGKTVGILRGGKFDEKFINDTLIKKVEVNDYNQMMQMLMSKRLDGALGSSIGLYYEANKLGYNKGQLGDPFILNTQSFILHFSRKNADQKMINDLKAAVERLKKQKAFVKIANKYMGDFNWSLNVANN